MRRSIDLARAHGVAVGAHPGFPDRVGFGWREIMATDDEMTTDVLYRVGALTAFCAAARIGLHHAKPHGAQPDVHAEARRAGQARCGQAGHAAMRAP